MNRYARNVPVPQYEEEEELKLIPLEAEDIQEEDVIQFAASLGIDPIKEENLMYIARESKRH